MGRKAPRLRYDLCPHRNPQHIIRGPCEWGSGLLTEVIAPQRDPQLQLQCPGEEVGKRNPHRSDCAADSPTNFILSALLLLPQAPSCAPPPRLRRHLGPLLLLRNSVSTISACLSQPCSMFPWYCSSGAIIMLSYSFHTSYYLQTLLSHC